MSVLMIEREMEFLGEKRGGGQQTKYAANNDNSASTNYKFRHSVPRV